MRISQSIQIRYCKNQQFTLNMIFLGKRPAKYDIYFDGRPKLSF